MADITRKQELRALDAEERELVASSYHPEVQALGDRELAELARRLRERRNRAQAMARQRRREIRGKAQPHGAAASRDDAGSRVKAEVLAGAMRRLNSESERRRRMQARLRAVENQRRALERKQAAGPADLPDNSRHAHEGMRARTNRHVRRLGSAMEAGRVSQAVKTAQARKDGRG